MLKLLKTVPLQAHVIGLENLLQVDGIEELINNPPS